MDFILGYAGIPHEIYDAVYQRRRHITGDNAEWVATSLASKNGAYTYSQSHANFFARNFHGRLANDHHNQLKDTAFGLIVIGHDEASTQTFEESFFPAIFCMRVTWEFLGTTDQSQKVSKNALIDALQKATRKLREAVPTVKKEVTQKDSSTPLLLPVKNFESKVLRKELAVLSSKLAEPGKQGNAILKKFTAAIELRHPRKLVDYKSRPCLTDDRDIEFHAPGKAAARHSLARPKKEEKEHAADAHELKCLLAGRLRLGVPYDRVFHYDCQRGERNNLIANLFNCHGDNTEQLEGDPHINISPNDNVRV